MPFKVSPDETEEREVEVVYISGPKSRMWVIIIKNEDGSYQDYYWNDNEERFKPLTYNYGNDEDDTFGESWRVEEVGEIPPKEFRFYVPKPMQ